MVRHGFRALRAMRLTFRELQTFGLVIFTLLLLKNCDIVSASEFRLPLDRVPVLPLTPDDPYQLLWMDERVLKPPRLGAPPVSRNVTAALIESIGVLDGHDEASARNLTLESKFVGKLEAQLTNTPVPDFKLNNMAYPLDRRKIEYLHLSDGNFRRKKSSSMGRTKILLSVTLVQLVHGNGGGDGGNSDQNRRFRPQDMIRDVTVSNGSFGGWISILSSPEEQLMVLHVDDDELGQVSFSLVMPKVAHLSAVGVLAGRSEDAGCIFNAQRDGDSEGPHHDVDMWQFDWLDEHMFQSLFLVPTTKEGGALSGASSFSFSLVPTYQPAKPKETWKSVPSMLKALEAVGAIGDDKQWSNDGTKSPKHLLQEYEVSQLEENAREDGAIVPENTIMIELHEIGSATVLSDFQHAFVHTKTDFPTHTCEGDGHLVVLGSSAFRMTSSCTQPPCGFYCRVQMEMIPGTTFYGGLSVEYTAHTGVPLLVRSSFDQSDTLMYMTKGTEVFVTEVDTNGSWVFATSQPVSRAVVRAQAPPLLAMSPPLTSQL